MFVDLVFYLAFSVLLAHELDAMHKREWRLLFILRTLPEEKARRAFVMAHVPLVALLLWLVANPIETVSSWTRIGLDVFMILHAGLHWRLENHSEYRFTTLHSRLLIYGTAALAIVHLGLCWLTQ